VYIYIDTYTDQGWQQKTFKRNPLQVIAASLGVEVERYMYNTISDTSVRRSTEQHADGTDGLAR